MLNKNLGKIPKLIIALMVFSLAIFYFPTQSMLMADTAIQENVSSPEESKPIVVYYTRTGTSRIVANILKDKFSCEITEIKSTEDRDGYLGAFTCVLDSLLDRDDIIEPFNKDLKGYSPIIIATPIWLGKISSPVRTLIKQAGLKDKDLYLFIAYHGRLTEEKEQALEDWITAQGINLKRLYKINTKEKKDDEIQKEVITQLNENPIFKNAVSDVVK